MLDINIEIAKDPENPKRDIILCKEKGLRIRVYDTSIEQPKLPADAICLANDNNPEGKLIFQILNPELYVEAHGWDALLYNYAIDWYLSFPQETVATEIG